MGIDKPRNGAPGTTDQSPRWEGPEETRPRGYLPAKDDPDRERDAAGETNSDPEPPRCSIIPRGREVRAYFTDLLLRPQDAAASAQSDDSAATAEVSRILMQGGEAP